MDKIEPIDKQCRYGKTSWKLDRAPTINHAQSVVNKDILSPIMWLSVCRRGPASSGAHDRKWEYALARIHSFGYMLLFGTPANILTME